MRDGSFEKDAIWKELKQKKDKREIKKYSRKLIEDRDRYEATEDG